MGIAIEAALRLSRRPRRSALPGHDRQRPHLALRPRRRVLFFTLDSPKDTTAIERAAEAAGGYLLGARAVKLDAGYLRELRDALDPDRIMNPGALA